MYVLHFVDINEVHLAILDELTFTEAMIDENRKEQVVLGHLSGIPLNSHLSTDVQLM